MTVWLLIAGMGLITYALRLSVIALLGRLEMPAVVLRALRFVPVAVLSAIIAPEVLAPGGALNVSWENARVPAAIIAAIIAWRTRNILATIGAGMAVLWILRALATRGG